MSFGPLRSVEMCFMFPNTDGFGDDAMHIVRWLGAVFSRLPLAQICELCDSVAWFFFLSFSFLFPSSLPFSLPPLFFFLSFLFPSFLSLFWDVLGSESCSGGEGGQYTQYLPLGTGPKFSPPNSKRQIVKMPQGKRHMPTDVPFAGNQRQLPSEAELGARGGV